MDSFYITTPIYYVNDVPHLGHAYTTIVADVLSRYHRSRGRDVHFLTGTDEHGQKIEEAATKQKTKPIKLADRVVSRFRQTWKHLGIGNDDFIRTTEDRHKVVVQEMWRRMEAAGDIYLGEYDGLYCVACEEYYTEGQLDEGNTCPVHHKPVEHMKQPSYFFKMSKYQDQLLEYMEQNPGFVQPEIRRNEIMSFVKGGLRDLSISRTTFNWGVPVPGDDDHVIYVWLDALTNYISALGGFGGDVEKYSKFWPATVHLIGKDILRHHAVYWPTMLMSAGLPLPETIFAHGWWTINGQKMSKSQRNVVEPNMMAESLGKDPFRYFVVRETPLGNDGDFSHEGVIHRINAELANDLGNLLKRSLAMAKRYCDGHMPAFADDLEAEEVDSALVSLATRARDDAAGHFEACAPSKALESIWELVRGANKYIDSTAPYTLIKDPEKKRRVEEVVANFLEALRWISLMVAPVMPDKATEMRSQLGLGTADIQGQLERWPERWGELPEGLELQPGEPLFPRIDDDEKERLINLWQGKEPAAEEEAKPKGPPPITFEEFGKLDLRVATVLEAAPVKKADKLLHLKVDLGDEQRMVVAGVAEAYKPEELVGRQVILLANLKPATIRGARSEGMILAAGAKKVLAISALDREVPAGTKVR